MHLKPKLSRGIDGTHALHIKNGGQEILEHLTIPLHMIFTQGLLLSTFYVGDPSFIPKEKNGRGKINAYQSKIFHIKNCIIQFVQA